MSNLYFVDAIQRYLLVVLPTGRKSISDVGLRGLNQPHFARLPAKMPCTEIRSLPAKKHNLAFSPNFGAERTNFLKIRASLAQFVFPPTPLPAEFMTEKLHSTIAIHRVMVGKTDLAPAGLAARIPSTGVTLFD